MLIKRSKNKANNRRSKRNTNYYATNEGTLNLTFDEGVCGSSRAKQALLKKYRRLCLDWAVEQDPSIVATLDPDEDTIASIQTAALLDDSDGETAQAKEPSAAPNKQGFLIVAAATPKTPIAGPVQTESQGKKHTSLTGKINHTPVLLETYQHAEKHSDHANNKQKKKNK